MTQYNVPTRLGQVTAEFLQTALGDSFPGTEVRSLNLGTVIHGTATKVRLLVDYNDTGLAHGLPPTMWFKGGLEEHSQTSDMLQVYAGEAAFYSQLADRIDVNIPRAYAARLDEASGKSFVLIEDLLARNASFGTALKPLEAGSMREFVDEMAKLHAAFWRSPNMQELSWLQGGGSLLQSCEAVITPDVWSRCSGLPRAEFVGEDFRDFDTFRAFVLNALRSDVEQSICFVHGDCHIGNTFSDPASGIGLLDWQSTMLGHWAHDLAYAIITSLTIEDRRAHERQLIDQYVEKLDELGIELDRDEAWLEYRRHTAYSCAWAICLPEWQPEEICCAVVERAFAAADDLNSLKAWTE